MVEEDVVDKASRIQRYWSKASNGITIRGWILIITVHIVLEETVGDDEFTVETVLDDSREAH